MHNELLFLIVTFLYNSCCSMTREELLVKLIGAAPLMCRTDRRCVTAQIQDLSVNNEPNKFVAKGTKWGAIGQYCDSYFLSKLGTDCHAGNPPNQTDWQNKVGDISTPDSKQLCPIITYLCALPLTCYVARIFDQMWTPFGLDLN